MQESGGIAVVFFERFCWGRQSFLWVARALTEKENNVVRPHYRLVSLRLVKNLGDGAALFGRADKIRCGQENPERAMAKLEEPCEVL